MVARSGDEVREALRNGRPVSWGFNPTEKRVELTLPAALGGQTHILCIAGKYTLTLDNDPEKMRWLLRELEGAEGASVGDAGGVEAALPHADPSSSCSLAGSSSGSSDSS
jgi:hypothetical protein